MNPYKIVNEALGRNNSVDRNQDREIITLKNVPIFLQFFPFDEDKEESNGLTIMIPHNISDPYDFENNSMTMSLTTKKIIWRQMFTECYWPKNMLLKESMGGFFNSTKTDLVYTNSTQALLLYSGYGTNVYNSGSISYE